MKKFEYYLQLCQDLLSKAAQEENPALWLYQNGFRTPMFMLEGLSKLYADLHNKKKFTKLRERFKLIEDMLGKADYYDWFMKEFATNTAIPQNLKDSLQLRMQEEIAALNYILKDKNWLNGKRISKIKSNLYQSNWLKEEKETKEICKFYNKEIKRIIAFVEERKIHFSNLEADVHELRRKLRWLSILPQALRGTIQLTADKPATEALQKYLVPEITNSAYNKMPDAAGNKYLLVLEQNHFYALSWMISELGKLKDSGLRLLILEEALQQTEKLSKKAATARATGFLGADQPALASLLKKAEEISVSFFKEKNLEKLVVGTAPANS